ncbi:phage portal protein [Paracoccaceae bacterium GXU_MW_L88]
MALNFFRSKAQGAAAVPETKASKAGRVVAFHGAGRAAWSARDVSSLVRSGFAGNPVVFRAVRMLAEAAASVPLWVEEGERRADEHPLVRLLGNPNPAQSGAELLEALYGQLLLSGNGYVEAAGEMLTGGPAELFVLRSDRMAVVPGPDGWPAAWDYAVGGKKVRFAAADPSPILHVKSFHPTDDHYGMSPLQAAATAMDVHNAASRWSKALLDNAARPSGAIVYKGADGQGSLPNDQYARLVDELEANHQGARNAGRPMLLEGGLDWKPMGFSPSDMEFHKTKEAAAREVALAFGVPPMLLGLPGDATYANYQEANRAFYRLTVLPMVQKVAGALGPWLSAHLGRDLRLRPDLDQVPALSLEREAQWARIAGADFLNDEEKRRLLGLGQ